MNAIRGELKTLTRVILFAILLAFVLSGCSNIDSNTIVSENSIDFNKDSRVEKLTVNMVEGKYHVENEAGPESGWDWEGKFVLQFIDSKGGVLSAIDLNKAFDINILNFKGKFSIEFDDYNGDGNIDFAIGQYTTGNRFKYILFTIKSDGKIELLPVSEGKILSYYEGYSIRFEKTNNNGFKARYYDNSLGKNIEVTYVWKNNQFVIENTAEYGFGKQVSDNTEKGTEDTPGAGKDTTQTDAKEKLADMLESIAIPNLNAADKKEVVLPLTGGFTSTRFSWNRPEGFEFKEQGNKSLENIYEYKIININGDEIGWFGLVERQQDEDGFSLPANLQFEDLRYKGPTKLGKGKIFLLWLDLPEGQTREDLNYYQEFFAYIPVENEDLAYNLRLRIPDSDKLEEVFSYVRSILITNENIEQNIYDLFKDDGIRQEDVKTLFRLLPYLDWGRFAGINDETFFNVIKWLQDYNYTTSEDIITVINSTNGLDGAYSEAFSYMLKSMFLKDEPKFIDALIKTDKEQSELICFYIVYALEGEENKGTIEYLKRGLQSGKYLLEERQVVEFILEALSAGI